MSCTVVRRAVEVGAAGCKRDGVAGRGAAGVGDDHVVAAGVGVGKAGDDERRRSAPETRAWLTSAAELCRHWYVTGAVPAIETAKLAEAPQVRAHRAGLSRSPMRRCRSRHPPSRRTGSGSCR